MILVKVHLTLITFTHYVHCLFTGFMIQGGCPEGTGMGGPGYSIKGEFSGNGFKNDLKHTEGVLSGSLDHHNSHCLLGLGSSLLYLVQFQDIVQL